MAAGVSAIGKLADVCKGDQIQGQTRGCAFSVKSPLRARREETGLTPSRRWSQHAGGEADAQNGCK